MRRESRDDYTETRRSNKNHRSTTSKTTRKNNQFKRKFHVQSRKVILAATGEYGDFEDKLLHFPSRLSSNATSNSSESSGTSSISDVSCYERKQDWKRVEHKKKTKKETIKSSKSQASSNGSSVPKYKSKSKRDSILEDEDVTTMGLCRLCGGTDDVTTSFEDSTTHEESYQNEKQVFVVEVLGNSSSKASISRRERQCLLRINMSSVDGSSRSIYYNLGINFIEVDGLAVVDSVMYPSSAHYSGVNKADVVNFAVPLNMNDEKLDLDLAKQIATRLEKTGRRTSYRDLYDMFSSKTTAGWPIAIVFETTERTSTASKRKCTIPDDCNLASRFLSSLSFNFRDSYWEDLDTEVNGNIEDFMLRPMKSKHITSINTPFLCGGASMGLCGTMVDFHNSRKLREVVNGTQAIAYFSCTVSSMGILEILQGSGIFVARVKEDKGRWSSPSALDIKSVNIKVGSFTIKKEVNCACFIYSDYIVTKLVKEGRYSFNNYDKLMHIIAYDGKKNEYYMMDLSEVTFNIMGNMNKQLYGSKVSINEIFAGDVKDYHDFKQLHGAIKSLEDPYTMYAHPVTPDSIKSFYAGDWSIEKSCTDDHGMDLRSYYADLYEDSDRKRSRRSNKSLEDLCEINIYLQKFIRFLIDGVPVRYLKSDQDDHDLALNIEEDKVPCIEMKKLCLIYEKGDSIDEPIMKLVFITEEDTKDVSSPIFEEEIQMDMISRLSKSVNYPVEMNKKRLLCIHDDGNNEHYAFFTRNDADHLLLTCGMKILLEKVTRDRVSLI